MQTKFWWSYMKYMQKCWWKIKCTYQSSTIYEYRKKRLITNAFFSSQFNHCSLTWMFHNRSLNHKINRLHERCLRVIYNDGHSSYDELLNLDNSVWIQKFTDISNRNVQGIHCSVTDILNEVFPKPPSNYNLRNQQEFVVRPIKTVHYGLNSLAYLEPRIWELLLNDLKRSKSLEGFKSKIKGWIPENCPYRIWIPYIYQVGFI